VEQARACLQAYRDAPGHNDMSVIRDAFQTLRPALGRLRTVALGRANGVFDGLSVLSELRRGILDSFTYVSDMAALRKLEMMLSSDRVPIRGLCDGDRVLRATLETLIFGVNVSAVLQGSLAPALQMIRDRVLRLSTPEELVAPFVASAQSLTHLELGLSSASHDNPLRTGILRAFLSQHPAIEHLTVRAGLRSAMLVSEHVVSAPCVSTLRLLDVDISVAALAALGGVVRRLIIGRSAPVATCPWPAAIGSAALPALAVVDVEVLARHGEPARTDVWTDVQRRDLADACRNRGVELRAFWH